MIKVTYNIESFDVTKARSGALCLMLKSSFLSTSPSTISNIVKNGTKWEENTNLGGVGICQNSTSNSLLLVIDNITYTFDDKGKLTQPVLSDEWELRMGIVQDNLVYAGNTVASTTTASASTRASVADIDYTGGNVTVDSLTPRDQFAVNVLNGILSHIAYPASLSDSQMNYFCNSAYQWAANMMSAAAASRANINISSGGSSGSDDSSGASTRAIDESSLSSNTEILLNDIARAVNDVKAALTKTTEENYGTWVNSYYQVRVNGEQYSDDTLAKINAEMVKHDVLYDTFSSLINDTRRWNYVPASNASYSERISIPALMMWLENYSQGSEDVGGTVGLQDLIDAINNISISGSGGGGSVSVDMSKVNNAIVNNRFQNSVTLSGGLGVNSSSPFHVGVDGTATVSGSITLNDEGIGSSASKPIYIVGGSGYSPRSSLAGELSTDTIVGFVGFNPSGAVGYVDIGTLAAALPNYISGSTSSRWQNPIYNILSSLIDARIADYINASYVTMGGRDYNLTASAPQS